MSSKKQPNIVIFNPDQMRADALHHLGNAAAITPNFDAILDDGVSFENAFCQNPVCTPSRCSFLTGWYPHVRGHRTMTHMLHKEDPMLFKSLRDAGYYVWLNMRNDMLPAQNKNYYSGYADEVMGIKIKQRGISEKIGNKKLMQMFNKQMNKALTQDPSRGTPESDTYYSFFKGKVKTAGGHGIGDLDRMSIDGALKLIHNRPKSQPFCVFLGLMAPHPPYGVSDPFFSQIDRSKLPERIPAPESWDDKPAMLKGLADLQHMHTWMEDRWDELRATYLGMVAKIDLQFGQIVQALKDEGIYDETAIFVLSDHGDFTGDYGLVEKNQNTFEDCLTNVPLMVKPPKGWDCKPGKRKSLVELIDFYATVKEIAGFQSNHTHFGKSLVTNIAGGVDSHRDAVFCEGGRLNHESHASEASLHPHLDPSMEYYPRMKLQRTTDGTHTKATMCRTEKFKYVRRFYEKDEFYDLTSDPQELHNKIDEVEYQKIIGDMKERMLTFYQETCDVVPKQTDSRFGPFEAKIFLKMRLKARRKRKKLK